MCLVGEVQATWACLSFHKGLHPRPTGPPDMLKQHSGGKQILVRGFVVLMEKRKIKNHCRKELGFHTFGRQRTSVLLGHFKPSVCSRLGCSKDNIFNILYLFQIALGEILMVPRNV